MSFTKDIGTKGSNSENIIRFPEYGPCTVKDWKEFLLESKENFNKSWNKKFIHQETLGDFELLSILGRGGFGDVVLIRQKHDKVYYAMKAMEKGKIVKSKTVDHVKNEKLVLQSINFPLSVHLIYCFKDNSFIYLVMPYVNGGELYNHLRECVHFSEDEVRFFISQIILAIEYLHYMDVIYRDLKPENILIDYTGYLKLTDFGHSKHLDKKRAYTLCGTPEYLAPEVITCKPYGKSVDWWAVGVLMFELVAGKSPFSSSDPVAMYQKILLLKYTMPFSFSNELKDLVRNILQKDLSKRYGNLKNGADDIKHHKWFKTINWMAILNRKVTAPFQPKCLDPEYIEKLDESHWTPKNITEENQYPEYFEDF